MRCAERRKVKKEKVRQRERDVRKIFIIMPTATANAVSLRSSAG